MLFRVGELCIALGSVAVLATVMAVQAPSKPGPQPISIGGAETPYTVVLRETVVGQAGAKSPGDISTFAVRSDGSFAQVIQSQLRNGRILHLAAGVRVETNDGELLRSTTVLVRDPAEWRRTTHSRCVGNSFGRPAGSGETLVGSEMLAGHLTARIADRKGAWWYSLEVGCAPMGSRTRLPDGRTSERVVIRLAPGEPDPALFLVGDNYTEVPPSRLLPPIAAECIGRCFEFAVNTRRMMDAAYEAGRAK